MLFNKADFIVLVEYSGMCQVKTCNVFDLVALFKI